MANYKWPNVYPSIQDFSGVVATNAVTSCGYVGEAEFGPINKPVLLTSLNDYTRLFGALSSKYGYAGYALAVASESINSHYFVRVVNAGNPEEHDPETDARYASVKIPAKGKEAGEAQTGWYVEQVESAVNTGDSGVFFRTVSNLEEGEPQVQNDETNAMIFVATDPNNRKLSVRLSDSTINENKAFAIQKLTCVATNSGGDASEGYDVTITTSADILLDVVKGDTITVTKVSVEDYNGTFVVTEASKSDSTATIKYHLNVTKQPSTLTPTFSSARIGKYPDANETTFQVEVLETIGKSITVVESFQFCTLYQAKDNYGSSTFVEDVINGSSNYIQVFVNPNLLEDTSDEKVLQPELTNTILSLTGGFSGKKPTTADLVKGWDCFKDRTQTNVSLLINSGYVSKEDTSYQAKMLQIAEQRRDCFCLFDIPMSETEYENAIDWRKNIQGFNSYRGAISAPWVKTFDSVQGRANFVMCPSAFLAKLIGAAGDPWNAPAGPNRGVISSSTVSPIGLTQAYNEVEGGILYTDNQINCMVKDVAAGYVNWGQRTLQQKPSALDRINVARTIIYIETILRDAARTHLFENNTPYERMQITLQFSSFLDTVLSAEGISSYKVVCDDTNNTDIVKRNNQLVIDIYIVPTYTTEVIILRTTVQGTEANVTVSSSAN